MAMGKKEPCGAGCGATGYFWSDHRGWCPECRKIECKGCKVRFTPNCRNPTHTCTKCRSRKKSRESKVEVSLC